MKQFFILPLLAFLFLTLVSCDQNNIIVNSEDIVPETFITYDEIFQDSGQGSPDRVQEFDLNASNLFVHPTGAFGLYQYNFASHEFRKLVDYGSGNYIAYDSIYVFYEISSYAIYRYNLVTDSTDLQLNLAGLDYTNIDGMDIYQRALYVYMHSQLTGNKVLVKYDLNGTFIESIPYPRHTIHMAIDNDIVYSIYFPDGTQAKLSRFSLGTNSFLEDKLLPTENWDGIRIFASKFYFTDYKKRFIGFIPISKLEN